MRNLKKSLQILALMVVTAVAVPVSPSWALAQTSEAAITPTEEVTTPSEEAITPTEEATTPTEEATTPTEEAIAQQRNLVVQRNFEVKALGDIWAEGARERRAAGYADARKIYQPTGLYAAANEQIVIDVSGDKPISAIIGTHRHDNEWAISYPLQPGINTISSPNGGLISFDNSNNEGSINVNVVSGGSPVPFFVLGKNTKADWQAMMSAYPNAPSVVLQSEKALLVFTYASARDHILNQDPVPVLQTYDTFIGAQDNISGLSNSDADPRHRLDKHLIGVIEQPNYTGGAYAYASWDGAIMPTSTGANADALDLTRMGWGQYHEAGHLRQQGPWTWGEMTEVTVNLYSLAAKKVLKPTEPARSQGEYLAAFTFVDQPTKNFSDSNSKLEMLWQLNLAFGDNFYPQLHRLYRELAQADLPTTDDQKKQAFILNTSKVAQYDLTPFFDKWGLPATNETKNKINALNLPLLTAPIWFGSEYNIIKPTDGMDKVKGIIAVTTNSQETSSAYDAAVNAFDGNTNSIWHTEWNKQNQFPYNITAKYANPSTFSKLTYLPRQTGGENGIITNYKILTSLDGVTFTEIATGTWAKDKTEKTVTFTPTLAKYVRLEVPQGGGTNGYASASEIKIFEAPQPVTTYLSDIDWFSATIGWGTVQKDRSVDGNTLKLNDKTYTKGLGTHANSEIVYKLNGQYTSFAALVGVDSEVGSVGTVEFQVVVDNQVVFSSGVMNKNTEAKEVNVNLSGKNELKLIVTDGGDGINSDHADWVNARLIK
ncbi:M60 family metallopeptidase [Paenibacillus motobuensis]|uniref:NPCBM/NEW2 domain-containing protein n=1 Tax=Paenibacillus TaxID=44249 RepID=UPI002041E44A|nr:MULTISPECIES: NPCBM/NEW2 domain-containing protein [Paenibacillus]MCM3042093.1 M60 family metallopeptidase [Paenibacillus lutimineralis]MCM3649197.1 M60 family metallopeptidase [Paenibacillus motobuensis]